MLTEERLVEIRRRIDADIRREADQRDMARVAAIGRRADQAAALEELRGRVAELERFVNQGAKDE